MHPFIIPGSLFVLSVAFLWAVYSSYKRHIRMTESRDEFRDHLARSGDLTFTCSAMVVDYAKVKVERMGVEVIDAYIKPTDGHVYPLSVEYALGRVKDYTYNYYEIYEMDPVEYLKELQDCVNSNMEDIHKARPCWDIIYGELTEDVSNFIQKNVVNDVMDVNPKDSACVFGFFYPIGKKEYEDAKENTSVFSITMQPFHPEFNIIKAIQKKDTKGKMKIEEFS